MNSDPLYGLWRYFTGHEGHLFYRCGGCGSVIDWRDMSLHLLHHGVTNSEFRAELIDRQERFAGLRMDGETVTER